MVKILLIRHAESEYNKLCNDFRAQNSSSPGPDQNWSLDPKVIDADLTSLGISQCQTASTPIRDNFPSIKYIFCSPLRRTIKTMHHCFTNYPGFPESIKIKVSPLIAEPLGCSGDTAFRTADLAAEFGHLYNFDFLQEYPDLADQRIWFAHNVNEAGDCTIKKLVIAEWKANGSEVGVIEVQRKEAEASGKTACDSKSVRARVELELIPHLRMFCEANGVQDGELAVVTHSTIL